MKKERKNGKKKERKNERTEERKKKRKKERRIESVLSSQMEVVKRWVAPLLFPGLIRPPHSVLMLIPPL